jgi:hypothetical protein
MGDPLEELRMGVVVIEEAVDSGRQISISLSKSAKQ